MSGSIEESWLPWRSRLRREAREVRARGREDSRFPDRSRESSLARDSVHRAGGKSIGKNVHLGHL